MEVAGGLLIVDKPVGPTSHDVVAMMRRALGTREVGHAGTLDPMASGVLVIMVGQGTKLSRFLVLDDKAYEATVRFGYATDTCDALGQEIERAPVPDALRAALHHLESSPNEPGGWAELDTALETERQRVSQTPPAHAAIKSQGVAAYRRARRGEQVQLAARDVQVKALEVRGASAERAELTVHLHVSKGYYVRAFARDLGSAIGVPAHLCALRRTRSGPYDLSMAVAPSSAGALLRQRLLTLETVVRPLMPCVELTEEGQRRAVHGQPMMDQHFRTPPGHEPSAWLNPGGTLVAIGDRSRGRPSVLRVFSAAPMVC